MARRKTKFNYVVNANGFFYWRGFLLYGVLLFSLLLVPKIYAATIDGCALTRLSNQAMIGDSAALAQLKKLSSEGDALAQALVAHYGLFRNDSFQKATPAERKAIVGLMKKSMDSGNALGMFLYGGGLLKSGKATNDKSMQIRANHLLKKSVLAMIKGGREKCGASYQFWLAVAYQHGFGVTKNFRDALLWLKRSAKNGFLPAQGLLGKALVMGTWTPRNCKVGLRLLRQNSEAGFALGTDMLGYLYKNGICVEKSPKRAVVYFEKAVKANLTVAYYSLGSSYIYGEGVQQDIVRGFELVGKAAARGYQPAMKLSKVVGEYWIAKRILDNPSSIPITQRSTFNESRAVKFLKDAADHGFTPAEVELEKITTKGSSK